LKKTKTNEKYTQRQKTNMIIVVVVDDNDRLF